VENLIGIGKKKQGGAKDGPAEAKKPIGEGGTLFLRSSEGGGRGHATVEAWGGGGRKEESRVWGFMVKRGSSLYS